MKRNRNATVATNHRTAPHSRWYDDFRKFYYDESSPHFSDYSDDKHYADMDDGNDDEEDQRYMPEDDPDIFGEFRL